MKKSGIIPIVVAVALVAAAVIYTVATGFKIFEDSATVIWLIVFGVLSAAALAFYFLKGRKNEEKPEEKEKPENGEEE